MGNDGELWSGGDALASVVHSAPQWHRMAPAKKAGAAGRSLPENLVEQGHIRIPRRKVLHRRQDGAEPLHDELAHPILLGQEGVQVLLQRLAGLLLLGLSAGTKEAAAASGQMCACYSLNGPACSTEGGQQQQAGSFSS